MAEKHDNDVEVYPGDVEGKHGGPIPVFLKLTYVGFTIFGITYWVLYKAGDGGPLVQLFNTLSK
jgi:hypothetical protein